MCLKEELLDIYFLGVIDGNGIDLNKALHQKGQTQRWLFTEKSYEHEVKSRICRDDFLRKVIEV